MKKEKVFHQSTKQIFDGGEKMNMKMETLQHVGKCTNILSHNDNRHQKEFREFEFLHPSLTSFKRVLGVSSQCLTLFDVIKRDFPSKCDSMNE